MTPLGPVRGDGDGPADRTLQPAGHRLESCRTSCKLYHLGVGVVTRSSLARVNAEKPWEMYEELHGRLLGRCQAKAPGHGYGFKAKLFSCGFDNHRLAVGVSVGEVPADEGGGEGARRLRRNVTQRSDDAGLDCDVHISDPVVPQVCESDCMASERDSAASSAQPVRAPAASSCWEAETRVHRIVHPS